MYRISGRIIAFILFSSPILLGQVQSARIVGTVYDPQRAAIPGAVVTVTDVATNVARKVTADGTGSYVVTPLDPGIYNVSASSTGFQTTTRSRVELVVGQ